MWPATSYISRHRRYMVLSLKRNFLLLFFLLFFLPPPLTAGDSISLCQVDPFAVISIRGKRRSGLRTGIQRASLLLLPFSSLRGYSFEESVMWLHDVYDLVFARAWWTWCVYICRKKGEGRLGVRALGEFRILTDESFRELPFARERSLLSSPRVSQ